MPELPVEKVFTDECDEAESHGCPQHVEDSGHVVNVQLAAHDLILLIVANASEPERFQLLHLPWRRAERRSGEDRREERSREKGTRGGLGMRKKGRRKRQGDIKKINRGG